MRYLDEQPPQPRRVKVRDREDVGIVIDPGKNFGVGGPAGFVYCLGIHFPDTGEVRYYDQDMVTDA
ncbi:hypothetical protein M8542_14330 [Amycolatopsis sp. OK19-0408]|uniref:Uncharacterized protein n=1 Tax=Amycolatopsis iheyensis TaxID=2945988 RepID=A0A9X2SJG0_9PSEU|nr:hypothetical protein [Amycolatopsis iheyensis]MCR6483998.1 hypothetical protein [Amycolatopsis iheyensis]